MMSDTGLRDLGSARRTALSALVAIALLAVYVHVVGIADVIGALVQVDIRRVASIAVVGFVPIVLWGLGLAIVLAGLGASVPLGRAIALFDASVFVNSVTPFGQVGGDPLSAVLVSRVGGTDYETGLVAIVSVNALDRLASVALGVVGAIYLVGTVASGRDVRVATAIGLVSVVGLVTLAVLAWRYRKSVVDSIVRIITPVARAVSKRIPGVPVADRRAIERRGERFVTGVEALVSEPKRLVGAFSLGVAGQFCVAVVLWLSLSAFGYVPSLAVVLAIIPVAKLSGVAPTPGGFGGAEALLLGLLVGTTAVTPAVAGVAVLLYRGAAFWLPTLTGGLVTAAIVSRYRLTPMDWRAAADEAVSEESMVERTGTTAADDDRSDGPGSERHRDLDGRDRPWTPRRQAGRVGRAGGVIALVLGFVVLGVVHAGSALVEPRNVLVHLTRDGGITLLALGAWWMLVSVVERFGDGTER